MHKFSETNGSSVGVLCSRVGGSWCVCVGGGVLEWKSCQGVERTAQSGQNPAAVGAEADEVWVGLGAAV